MSQGQSLRVGGPGGDPRVRLGQVHLGEAGRVPQFVDETTVAVDALLVHADLATLGGKGGEGEAEGVGAVLPDHHQRIDDVARGLGHLLAELVAHERVQVDVAEGHLVHEVQAHHHHSRHPEEEDVETGDEHRGRVEGGQFLGLRRPAQGGEGPQGRAEPGVEHVVFLAQAGRAAERAHVGFLDVDHQLAAALAGPGRDAVAPPDLPADAPVADVLHPAVEGAVPGVRVEPDAAFLNRGHRLVGQRANADEPLLGGGRLDHRAAAVALAHRVLVVLDALEEALFLQVADDLLAAGEPVKPGVAAGGLVHHALVVHHLEPRQVVAQTDLVVVAVVRRGDLERAGAELALHVVVEHHRDGAAGERQADADLPQVLVALVVRVDRHRGVAEHGLRPGGGHHHVARAVGIRVADVVELAVRGVVLDLVVGERGVAARTPVDDVVALVDEAFLVQPDEHLAHRPRQPLVHGEPLAVPVTGGAHALQLVDDGAALLLPPGPDPLDEPVPAEVVAAQVLGGQLAFDHVLGGDAGMVRARHPQGVVAAHAVVAHQEVLQGVVQGMADVEHAGDVGRRDDDGERRLALVHAGAEGLVVQPAGVPALFDLGEFVGLGQGVFVGMRCGIVHGLRSVAPDRRRSGIGEGAPRGHSRVWA